MPYTPPSHRSPASSAPSSPDVSRRSSFHGTGTSVNAWPHGSAGASASRPALPRSASYLTKSRRTPPAPSSADASTPDLTPPGTSEDLKGAMISPPESQSSSEDESAVPQEKRGREIENLKELQDAISTISQHRESSPSRTSPGDLLVLPSQIDQLAESVQGALTVEIPELRITPRKISHARSNTEPSIFVSKSADASLTASEDSDDDEPMRKPQMVRKKSGELVRPALRPAASRRPSSMPGTPTFSKAVHFDSHLEHVRHFLQVDRPLAVSAGSSPADNYESDTEYPFSEGKSGTRSPPHEWELVTNNFPAETPVRKSLPARMERVWMSVDQKSLLGSIAIANLAFQKSVVCRFTFDYWKTTSEVTAEWNHEIRPKESETGHDRFQFCIKLSDLANLESKTLYFCIRYHVNGQEYWDNNNGMNFQVDFRKKLLPMNGKKNFQGASSRSANGLPRSGGRRSSTVPRPKSMPVGALDDFGEESQLFDFEHPIHDFLGESGPKLRLKSSKSTTSLPSDNLANRLSAPSGLAFANRYDFGASLSAAKQAQKDTSGSPRTDGLYMKAHQRSSFEPSGPSRAAIPPSAPPKVAAPPVMPPVSAVVPSQVFPASAIPGTGSPASSIASASYEEIVNKYCFFNGSKQSSPQLKDGTLRSVRLDGANDEAFTQATDSSTASSSTSPQMADRAAQHGALRFAIHQNLNPYFQGTHLHIGASPAESPLNGLTAVTRQSSSPNPETPTAQTEDGYAALAGTPTGDYPAASPFQHAQHHSDRFPFAADSHTSPAIRG